jgi:signal transduction histidine kinase
MHQANPTQAKPTSSGHANVDVLRASSGDEGDDVPALPTPCSTAGPSQRLLADASKRLAASLDIQVTLRRVVEVGLPSLGEACLVFLLRDGRTIESLVTGHIDPARGQLLRTLERAPEWEGWPQVCRVARTRQPVALSARSTTELMAGDSDRPRIVELLGFKAALIVPIANQTWSDAVVVFLSTRPRRYGRARRLLAGELAERFQLALRAAREFEICQAAGRALEEHLATTAHDLVAPLAFIKGSAQMLQRLDVGSDPAAAEQLRHRLAAVDAATTKMSALLQGLIYKAEPPQAESEWDDSTDLVAIIRAVIAEQQPAADGRTIRFLSEEPVVRGPWHASQIDGLIANLVGNAVKYSSAGTVVDVTLTRARDTDGEWAVVRVTDQGIGIPARDLPFVLEAFRRGSNVGQTPGSGLGLASAFKTTKMHAGRLWVESEEGRGTSVTVKLPFGVTQSSRT